MGALDRLSLEALLREYEKATPKSRALAERARASPLVRPSPPIVSI